MDGLDFILILAGIPAYNEAKHISQVVEETKLYVDKVLVVDDGSKDNTAVLAYHSGAKVIRHPVNYGMGAAENTILNYARTILKEGDILITLDSDGQHFPSDIPKMLERLNMGDCDFVNGSRLYDKNTIAGISRPTAWRRILNRIATYAVRMMSSYYSSDSQSGFRAYNYKMIKGLKYTSIDYAWNSEGYIRLHRLKARIGEVSVKTVWTPPSNPDKHHATVFYGIKVLGRLFLIWIRIIK